MAEVGLLRTAARSLRGQLDAVEMVTLAAAGRSPVHRVRTAAVRAWGGRVAETATLYHGFQIRSARSLTVGERSSVGDGCILDARGGLTIGDDVNLSTGVSIWTAQHGWNAPDFAYETAPVTVGDRAWISTRVVVLPGVTIGEGAVVAAGAVVAKDVPPYTLVGGVPARHIADRRRDLDYRLPPARRKAWFW